MPRIHLSLPHLLFFPMVTLPKWAPLVLVAVVLDITTTTVAAIATRNAKAVDQVVATKESGQIRIVEITSTIITITTAAR